MECLLKLMKIKKVMISQKLLQKQTKKTTLKKTKKQN